MGNAVRHVQRIKGLFINEDDSSAVRRTKDSFREELYRRYKPSENETAKSVPVRRQL